MLGWETVDNKDLSLVEASGDEVQRRVFNTY
jgi:hypothetical protein